MKPLYLYSALLLLTQCSKCKDDPRPEDKLPPATQEGKNTFGCLVNGQPWTPLGNNGAPNFHCDYDPGLDGGTLQVSAYRFPQAGGSQSQGINLLGRGILPGPGTYPITLADNVAASYDDEFRDPACRLYYGQNLSYRRGRLTVTRLDLQAGVVAGTFEYTLSKPGCDSVRITAGRFDYKLY